MRIYKRYENIYTDSQGKYIIMVFTLWQQRYAILAIYIPPPFPPEILNAILERIIQHCPAKLRFMVNFNSIMSPNLDRPRPPKQHSVILYNWAQATGVTEV